MATPKVVLVTGAGAGFGRHTANLAAERGHVVYASVRAPERCEPFVSSNVTILKLDVTRADEREAAVARVLAERGRVDALVNNAGVALGGFLETVDDDELRALFDTNVFAAFALTKLVLPAMRGQGSGEVVMVSSMAGRMAMPGLGAYAGSKFALEGLSEAWRHELAPHGVRVTLVEPGPYKTDIFGRNRSLARRARDPGPYADRTARVDKVAERLAASAGDPLDVARRIVEIVEGRHGALRQPMGPSALARTWLLRLAPFGVVEWLVARIAG